METTIRILHLEDDIIDMELLREYLENEPRFHYQLKQFRDIESIRDYLKEGSKEFDVSIIDLGLAKTRGIDTYREFKGLGLDIPVIVLTGLDDKETGEKVIAEGGQDYLIKGKFNSCNLVHSVKFAIGRFEIENRLRDQEHLYRSIFDNVFDALIITDRLGIIEYVNPSAGIIFGSIAAGFSGQDVTELVIEENRFLFKKMIENIENENLHQVELEGIHENGKPLIIQVSCKNLYLNEKDMILVIMHDVTAMVKAERELIEYKNNLEDLVKEKTQEVEEKYFELAKDYKLMLGREYRIKELREEVKELKNRIAKYEN